jgi:hypothetical protein
MKGEEKELHLPRYFSLMMRENRLEMLSSNENVHECIV